jgi:hypothetical protein
MTPELHALGTSIAEAICFLVLPWCLVPIGFAIYERFFAPKREVPYIYKSMAEQTAIIEAEMKKLGF